MTIINDDYPEVGSLRQGMVLVCHGDDWPTEFTDWLQPLVNEFEKLSAIASKFNVEICLEDGGSPVADTMDFCKRLGIQFDSSFYEGSLISGIYHFGWIDASKEQDVHASGNKLVQTLAKRVGKATRSKVIQDLKQIEDLDEFICRTADREPLQTEMANLRSSLQTMKSDLDTARAEILSATALNTEAIDRACVRLAAAILSNEIHPIVAGPLVLWNDGVVYAICSWGGVPIPEGSSPAILLEGIRGSNQRLVLIEEATVIGGWLSGPIYRKGPTHISGWSQVWIIREKNERFFSVDPPEYAGQVKLIHETLAKDPGSSDELY